MDTSIFSDKAKTPSDEDLKKAIGSTYKIWISLRNFVRTKYPAAIEEWNFPGEKYGWSFRMKDKKRAIIYFLPRDNFFKAAFVFGQKAYEEIQKSSVSKEIKTELGNAKVYAEGRGIRVDVKDESTFEDVKLLAEIKLRN